MELHLTDLFLLEPNEVYAEAMNITYGPESLKAVARFSPLCLSLVSQARGLTVSQRHLKAPSSMKTNLDENIPILQTLGSSVNKK